MNAKVIWSAKDVADFLGIDRESAHEMMRLGVIESRAYCEIVPRSKSRSLRTTKYHVLAGVAKLFGNQSKPITEFYNTEAHDARRTAAATAGTSDHAY